MLTLPRLCRLASLAISLICLLSGLCSADIQLADSYFRPDVIYPEFACLWSNKATIEDCGKPSAAAPGGATVHIYFRNGGGSAVSVEDVSLEGISLKRAIANSTARKFKKTLYAASIFFADLSAAERDSLIAAGEPVWWKAEPQIVEPGAMGEVIVRLRRTPRAGSVKVRLNAGSASLDVPVSIGGQPPKIVGAAFSPTLDVAYLYLQHPDKTSTISRVLMDGRDVTSLAMVGRDPTQDVVPVVCKFASPLKRGALYCFQVVYEDSSKATSAVRPWGDEFGYGMWGTRPGKDTEVDVARKHLTDMAVRGLNVMMPTIGSDAMNKFFRTEECGKMMDAYGIRRVVEEPEKTTRRWAIYLADEPDAADSRVKDVPQSSAVGCLGQGLVGRAYDMRKIDPLTPNMLNIDQTYRPQNWYTYAQLPDVYAADPYYQTHLAEALWKHPNLIPMYSKCTFVYGVASICNSSCAPNPLHIMLNSVRTQRADAMFRWATREEKRIELYYALAAGAKQISYWWFLPIGPKATGANGCGANVPEAKALWNEIGLLGNELRAAGPILVKSCPTSLAVSAPPKLWVRSLAAGLDTVVLLCVNDDYANDAKGTTIRTVENAEVSVALPKWLDPKSVFEISYRGTADVKWESGERLSLHLGTVPVTRMIVVTSDSSLRAGIQKSYDTGIGANVAKLLAE